MRLIQVQRYVWICHRRPERSFFYNQHQFPVCARCTGIWLGYAVGIIITAFYLPVWWVGILLLIPLLIDAGTQLIRIRTSTNSLRLITGLLAGWAEIIILTHILIILMQYSYELGYKAFS
ncbi:MAG: DUF2085 domain-containing protein [bacterium]|nr:DUF2085 domain-containing protein [bacterium]